MEPTAPPPPPPPAKAPVKPATVQPGLGFEDLIKQKETRDNLNKKAAEGIPVRTKEGEVYLEKIVDGQIVRENIGKKDFTPIEGAPDPEVCFIDEFLFLGSQDAAVNVDELKQKNVSHILNVATGITNAFPHDYTYCNVEVLDVYESPIVERFQECFDFIEKAKSSKTGVLVHCNAGVSRSATVVIAYLMKTKKLTFKDAFAFVKEKRSKINPNPGFVEQLKKYEETLNL